MSYDTSHSGEKPHFAIDDVVYFLVEARAGNDGARKLQIRKGTVSEPHPEVVSDKPRVRTWESLDEPPSGIRVLLAKDPEELLTSEDVLSVAREQGEHAASADEAIRANHDELAIAIGTTLMFREIDQLGA